MPGPVCLAVEGDEDSVGQCPSRGELAGAALPAPGAALRAQLADVVPDPGLLLLSLTAKQAPVVLKQSCLTPKLGGELPAAFSG